MADRLRRQTQECNYGESFLQVFHRPSFQPFRRVGTERRLESERSVAVTSAPQFLSCLYIWLAQLRVRQTGDVLLCVFRRPRAKPGDGKPDAEHVNQDFIGEDGGRTPES